MARESSILFVRLRSPVTGEWLAHPDLRRKLVEEAEEKGSNLTDVAIEILSRRCNVKFVPNGRKTSPSPDARELNLGRVSDDLWRALAVAGTGSRQDAARTMLCQHYGLRAMPPVKRGRRARGRRPAPGAATA
jgi:hypothetical protein